MNWPGANEVMNILSGLPRYILIQELEKATTKARNQNDVGWLYWLRELMEKNNLNSGDFTDKTIYTILKNSTEM